MRFAGYPVGADKELVMGYRTTPPRCFEAVTDFHTLDGLDAHERACKLGIQTTIPVNVRTKSRGKAIGENLDDTTNSVALFVSSFDLRVHECRRFRVKAAQRVGIQCRDVSRVRERGSFGNADRTNRNGVAHKRDAKFVKKRASNGTEGNTSGGFPGAGSLQNGACFVKVVLLHANEVGMSRTWPGQRGSAPGGLGFALKGFGAHDVRPLGPL
jgi:hypothetical protein